MTEVRLGRRGERRAHPYLRDTGAVQVGDRVEEPPAERFGPEVVAARGREAERVAQRRFVRREARRDQLGQAATGVERLTPRERERGLPRVQRVAARDREDLFDVVDDQVIVDAALSELGDQGGDRVGLERAEREHLEAEIVGVDPVRPGRAPQRTGDAGAGREPAQQIEELERCVVEVFDDAHDRCVGVSRVREHRGHGVGDDRGVDVGLAASRQSRRAEERGAGRGPRHARELAHPARVAAEVEEPRCHHPHVAAGRRAGRPHDPAAGVLELRGRRLDEPALPRSRGLR